MMLATHDMPPKKLNEDARNDKGRIIAQKGWLAPVLKVPLLVTMKVKR